MRFNVTLYLCILSYFPCPLLWKLFREVLLSKRDVKCICLVNHVVEHASTYLCWPFINFKIINEDQKTSSKWNFNSVTLNGTLRQVVRLYSPKYLQGKAIPIQAWTSSYGSRRLWLPEFLYNRHTKVERCQLYIPAIFTTRRHPWYLLILKTNWSQDCCATGKIKSMKNPSDPIGNRTINLPTCSAEL